MECKETLACRTCLAVDVKLYHNDYGKLRTYYEDLLDIRVSNSDGLPQYFCYMCTALLQKYHNFKQRCEHVNQLLLDIVSSGRCITDKAIKGIDRAAHNLLSPIDFWFFNTRLQSIEYKSDVVTSENTSKTDKLKLEDLIKVEGEEVKIEDVVVKLEEEKVIRDGLESGKANICNDMGFDYILFECDDEDHHQNDLELNDTEILSTKSEFNPSDEEIPLKMILNCVKKENRRKLKRKLSKDSLSGIKNQKVKDIQMKRTLSKKHSKLDIDPKPKLRGVRRDAAPLNGDNWEETDLTEEEQLDRFRKKLSKAGYQQASFQCHQCHRGFQDEDSFSAHKILHAPGAGQYECWICKIRFKRKCMLRVHSNFHKRQYKCKRCDFTTVSRHNTHSHDKFHDGIFFECDICNMKFRKQQSLRTHTRISHRSDCICPLCGENFLNEKGLRNHQKKMHSPESIAKGPADDSVYCEDCDITFHNAQAHTKHLRTSSKHVGITVSGPRQAYKVKGGANRASQKGDGTARKRPMEFRGRVTCHLCDKQFRDDLYIKHFKCEHPGQEMQKRYMCDVCAFSTARINLLENHMRTHAEQRNYACNQCDWKFKTINGLHNHRVVHTKEKRYECKDCGKRYTRSENLRLHFRTAHLKQPYPKRERRKKNELVPVSTEPVVPPHQGEFHNAYEYMVYRNAHVPY